MQMKEECRDRWGVRLINELLQDLRYGLRQLRRNPGFTIVVVLTLALGIGSSTVIFSLFHEVFLRPLRARDPDQLVRLVSHVPKVGSVSHLRYDYIRALHDRAKSFQFVFGQTGENYHFAMSDPAPTQAIALRAVTPDFFEALGVKALYGRVLTSADATEEPGPPPAVLSYAFWKRRFGADPRAIRGRTIILNSHHLAVVGVMPRDFGGVSVDTAPDLWIPMRTFPVLVSRATDKLQFDTAARLKPRVTLATAQAECQAIWKPVMMDYYTRVYPKLSVQADAEMIRWGVWLQPLGQGVSALRQRYGDVFKLLMASAGLLFLVACANIAGLLLARNEARQQEIAVRLAVGATRWRLARQMLTEGLILAAMGTAGGLLVARAAMPFAAGQLPTIHDLMGWPVPVSIDAHISVVVFLFSLLLTILATLFFGLAPAMANARTNLDAVLRSSRFGARLRGRQFLNVVEVALCVMLLTAAGLFVRTFRKLARTDPGFNMSRVATFTQALMGQHAPPGLLKTVRERVREMPGVVSAATASLGVMRGHGESMGLAPAGQRMSNADWLNANVNYVSPGYFDTMGIQVIEGRVFTPFDEQEEKQNGPEKAVVNQTLARDFFPKTDPVGKLFGSGRVGGLAREDYQVIGVVNDIKYRSLREPMRPELYLVQKDADFFVLYVHARMSAEAMIVPVQRTLASIDPSLPVGLADSLSDEVNNSIDGERDTAVLASLFGIAAALLVCLGIYGLLAYSVAQRQREIGIRMALGAEKGDVLRMVIGQGLRLTLIGVAIGIAGALALTRFLSSMLYGVTPTDPLTFIAVSLILMAVALLACYIPARRAAKVDPMVALRYE
ncbi:MAG TPA: ABC transporter permease [Terriglobia bacterium]|nr:ABC transporter permease [Terriglobia bacterium]